MRGEEDGRDLDCDERPGDANGVSPAAHRPDSSEADRAAA